MARNGQAMSTSTHWLDWHREHSDKRRRSGDEGEVSTTLLPRPDQRCGWYGGGLGPDGSIYCAPAGTGRVLRIAPANEMTAVASAALIGSTLTGSYVQAVRAGADGNLFCVPHRAASVVRIDPGRSSTEPVRGGEWDTQLSWDGGVEGPDGAVYAVPRNNHGYGRGMRVLRIDPDRDVAEPFGDAFTGEDLWMGGVRGADGRIYAAPAHARRILCIDPTHQTTSLVGDDLGPGGFKWWGGALGSDGRVYFVPRNAPRVLRFDPASGACELIGDEMLGDNKWVGGAPARRYF